MIQDSGIVARPASIFCSPSDGPTRSVC